MKKAKRTRKSPVLHPKCERDCHFCQEDKRKRKAVACETPVAWRQRKGKGGPKKKVATAGYFCPNESCAYYRFANERIHALVGYGKHGLHEEIRDFKCQACGKKFTARQNTVLYQLKSHSGRIDHVVMDLTVIDPSNLEEALEMRVVVLMGQDRGFDGDRNDQTRDLERMMACQE